MAKWARLTLAIALTLALQSAAFARVGHELAHSGASAATVHETSLHEPCVHGAPGAEDAAPHAAHSTQQPAPSHSAGHSHSCTACLPCQNSAAVFETVFVFHAAPAMDRATEPAPKERESARPAQFVRAHPARAPPTVS